PMLSQPDSRGFVYTRDRSEQCLLKDGFGCFTNGKIFYHGEWSNGMPNGLGCLATSSYVYYGQICRGIESTGKGSKKVTTVGCISFAGKFTNGSPDGPGAMTFRAKSSDDANVDSSGPGVTDYGLPRHEGIFRGVQLLVSLQTQAVVAAVRFAKRARARLLLREAESGRLANAMRTFEYREWHWFPRQTNIFLTNWRNCLSKVTDLTDLDVFQCYCPNEQL
uniref:Nonstructural protein n=1 Tax=Macrostomum lignano TaxID=282301 RepID=A0A1I8JAR0_9PLAT